VVRTYEIMHSLFFFLVLGLDVYTFVHLSTHTFDDFIFDFSFSFPFFFLFSFFLFSFLLLQAVVSTLMSQFDQHAHPTPQLPSLHLVGCMKILIQKTFVQTPTSFGPK